MTISLTAPLSPDSSQLVLALRSRISVPFVLRRRVLTLDRRIRLYTAGKAVDSNAGGNGVGSRESGDSWMLTCSSDDSFAGWSGSESTGTNREYQRIAGEAVAGIIFFAGLTFVTLSLIERNTSRPQQHIEPFSAKEEAPMSFENWSNSIQEKGSEYDNWGCKRSYWNSQIPDNSSFETNGIAIDNVSTQEGGSTVLVRSIANQVQCQALAAMQALKVIEADVQPSDICTHREYARWLLSASSILSRNAVSKVYPAMYVENVTELAFDDLSPQDPDFSSIQGLAEAGLISSKLSRRDMLHSSNEGPSPFFFSPDSPLSRQDLLNWKMSLEKRHLHAANRESLQKLSGFLDIDRINPDSWPAIMADLSAGEQGIVALAFGYTKLFQPDKPVMKAQAAIALATGDFSDAVSEELARIELEAMAENAIASHAELVSQVEKDIHARFEKELLMEREKIDAVEKMIGEARRESERIRTEREEQKTVLMKEHDNVESEMEDLSRIRRAVEEQLHDLLNDKVKTSFVKESIDELRKQEEFEKAEIAVLRNELDVERQALFMTRMWAETVAQRAKEQAKALEEARSLWQSHGLKVTVDADLQEEASTAVTWLDAGRQISLEGTIGRAENLIEKLKAMASMVGGKFKHMVGVIVLRIILLTSTLKNWTLNVYRLARACERAAVLTVMRSAEELGQSSSEFKLAFREEVEKIARKFKT